MSWFRNFSSFARMECSEACRNSRSSWERFLSAMELWKYLVRSPGSFEIKRGEFFMAPRGAMTRGKAAKGILQRCELVKERKTNAKLYGCISGLAKSGGMFFLYKHLTRKKNHRRGRTLDLLHQRRCLRGR